MADGNRPGIEQQRSGFAVHRQKVCEATIGQHGARDFGLAAIAGCAQGLRVDRAGIIHPVVGPQHNRAAIAGLGRRGLDAGGGIDRHIGRHRYACNGLPFACPADKDGAPAGRAAGVELGLGEVNRPTTERDRTALAFARTGGDLAADRESATGAAIQDNLAAFLVTGRGGHFSRDVDNAAHRLLGGCRLDLDTAASGRNRASHVDELLPVSRQRRCRHSHLQEVAAIQIERRLLARAKTHFAERRRNCACIGNTAPQQGHKPVSAKVDLAIIGDRSRCTIAFEVEFSGVKILIGDPERRRDKAAAHIDDAGFGDGNAVGVDEIDLAIGIQIAGNRRGRIARDTVEHGRSGIGLLEGHGIAGTDREAAPVDDRITARLRNRERIGIGRSDARRTRGHRSAGRQNTRNLGSHKAGRDQIANSRTKKRADPAAAFDHSAVGERSGGFAPALVSQEGSRCDSHVFDPKNPSQWSRSHDATTV